jgi:hypothetical protein
MRLTARALENSQILILIQKGSRTRIYENSNKLYDISSKKSIMKLILVVLVAQNLKHFIDPFRLHKEHF